LTGPGFEDGTSPFSGMFLMFVRSPANRTAPTRRQETGPEGPSSAGEYDVGSSPIDEGKPADLRRVLSLLVHLARLRSSTATIASMDERSSAGAKRWQLPGRRCHGHR
jgi:hypothetical protein